MSITPDNFKWADSSVNDGTTGQPNKVEPDSSQKSSGLLREEPIARPHLNWQFDQYHKAFIDLQSQINSIVADAGNAVLQKAFPVGSVYTSTTAITDPSDAALLGFGTWVRLKGKFLVGVDEADTSFDGLGETGGAKVHTHTNNLSVDGHVLSITEMPTHTISTTIPKGERGSGGAASGETLRADNLVTNGNKVVESSPIGSSQAHSHNLSGGVSTASSLPPYYSAYMWRRTA